MKDKAIRRGGIQLVSRGSGRYEAIINGHTWLFWGHRGYLKWSCRREDHPKSAIFEQGRTLLECVQKLKKALGVE